MIAIEIQIILEGQQDSKYEGITVRGLSELIILALIILCIVVDVGLSIRSLTTAMSQKFSCPKIQKYWTYAMITLQLATFITSAINFNLGFVKFSTMQSGPIPYFNNTTWCVILAVLAVLICLKTVFDLQIVANSLQVYLFFNLTQSVDQTKISNILKQLKSQTMGSSETLIQIAVQRHSQMSGRISMY